VGTLRVKLSGARKLCARYSTPVPRKLGFMLSQKDGGTATSRRGRANWEEESEDGTDRR